MKQRVQSHKIIVAIPTRNRPQYLETTIKSVAQQARKYGHDVEIVVSDTSFGKEPRRERLYSEINSEVIERLRKKYKRSMIHYYAPSVPEPIKQLFQKATDEELEAYSKLLPDDGHWGAHRNRLALLAVYHGGKNAAYLHLDDDTPLLVSDAQGNFKTNPQNVLKAFLKALDTAVRLGARGATGEIHGVIDTAVSGMPGGVERKEDPKKLFVGFKPSGHLCGPARITTYEVMSYPYIPYGRNSDLVHALYAAGGRYFQVPRPGQVLHIGITGTAPAEESKELGEHMLIVQELQPIWSSITEKMAALRHRQSRQT